MHLFLQFAKYSQKNLSFLPYYLFYTFSSLTKNWYAIWIVWIHPDGFCGNCGGNKPFGMFAANTAWFFSWKSTWQKSCYRNYQFDEKYIYEIFWKNHVLQKFDPGGPNIFDHQKFKSVDSFLFGSVWSGFYRFRSVFLAFGYKYSTDQ